MKAAELKTGQIVAVWYWVEVSMKVESVKDGFCRVSYPSGTSEALA